MNTPIVVKSAGPAGAADVAPDRPRSGFKLRIASFMLEDYLESIAARHALNDPENAGERVPWQQLKGQLGL